MINPEAQEARDLYDQVEELFAGRSLPVIGTVLVHLVATWLQNHVVQDDEEETAKLRIRLLMNFLRGVAKDSGMEMELVGPHQVGHA